MLKDVPVLIPGRYVVQGYDGRPRVKTFTAADIPAAVTNGNAQLAAGLRTPVCWMHDPDAEPEYLSHKDPDYLRQRQIAAGFIGDVKRYYARGGKAYAVVDIGDPADAAKFDRIGTVSPSLLHDWMDEKGKVWKGLSILHIGSTPKPVQRHLPRVSAYRQSSPSDAVWFSINIPTGRPVMADEIEIDDMADDAAPDFTELEAALKKLGVHIDGNPQSMDELLIAVKTAAAMHNGGKDDDEDGDDMDLSMDTDTESVAPPAFMSHYLPKIAAYERDQREADIKALAGHVDGKTVERLKAELDAELDKTNLSHEPARFFTRKGDFKPLKIDHQIAAYKLLPPGRFKTNLSHGTVPVPPTDKVKRATPEDKDEEAAKELIDYSAGKKPN
jgi:hypothetical protein